MKDIDYFIERKLDKTNIKDFYESLPSNLQSSFKECLHIKIIWGNVLQGYRGPTNFCNNGSGDSAALDSYYGVQEIKFWWGARKDLNSQIPIFGSMIFGIGRIVQEFQDQLDWSSLYFDEASGELVSYTKAQQIIQNNKEAVNHDKRGNELFKEGRYKEALEEFQKAYNKCSAGYSEEDRYKSNRDIAKRKVDELEAVALKNEEIRRKNIEAVNHDKRGNELFKEGRYKEALEEFQKAYNKCSAGYSEEDRYKSNRDIAKRKVDELEAVALKNEEIRRKNIEADNHDKRGNELFNKQGKYKEALEEFEQACRKCSAGYSAEARFKSNRDIAKKKVDELEAKALINEEIKRKNIEADNHEKRGNELFNKQGKYKEALEEFEQACKKCSAGYSEEARFMSNRDIAQEEVDATVLKDQGDAEFNSGRYDVARLKYQRAYDKSSVIANKAIYNTCRDKAKSIVDAKVLKEQGDAEFNAGRYDSASVKYRQAYDKWSRNANDSAAQQRKADLLVNQQLASVLNDFSLMLMSDITDNELSELRERLTILIDTEYGSESAVVNRFLIVSLRIARNELKSQLDTNREDVNDLRDAIMNLIETEIGVLKELNITDQRLEDELKSLEDQLNDIDAEDENVLGNLESIAIRVREIDEEMESTVFEKLTLEMQLELGGNALELRDPLIAPIVETYLVSGMNEILQLRISSIKGAITKQINLLHSKVIGTEIGSINLYDVVQQLVCATKENTITVIPLLVTTQTNNGGSNINHWVGLISERTADGILMNYVDSENSSLDGLKEYILQAFKDDQKVYFKEIPVEQQRYNNCGSELIENIILYITGSRMDQESAIYLHSSLKEQSLMMPNIKTTQANTTLTKSEQRYQSKPADKVSDELNSLLKALEDKPYKFIFDPRASKKVPPSPARSITIKLNVERTLLCIEHNNEEVKIENDGNLIIDKEVYNNVRSTLQNKRTPIPEDKWDESFKLVKQQIVSYLVKENKMLKQDGFLMKFQQFIQELPDVSHEFINSSRELMKINFDDWDIEESEESEENDPRLEALTVIHSKMLASFDAYKTMGEKYIEQGDSLKNTNIKTQEEEENIDINTFNIVNIPGDGNCFYSAVADQLKTLDIQIKNIQPTHQDLREITIDYIKRNTHQEFGKNLEERLSANSDLRGDLPSNIRSIDEYMELHSGEGVWADSGMVGALAQALDVTIRIYHDDGMPGTYNAPQSVDPTINKFLNLQYTGNHYNSLVAKSVFDLLPFEKEYPEKSQKIKRIFELLNERERGDKLDSQIGIIADKLGLTPESSGKLKDYFNVSIVTKPKKRNDFVESGMWYTDDDMNSYGRVLERHGVDLETQFANRLTEDDIGSLPSIDSLTENQPRYICYSIGGRNHIDHSGMHWVAIVLVKRGQIISILYKDPKGDWKNSSEAVESLFKKHYNNMVEFIKDSQAEQEDDSSCGPMTLNNLEIMAKQVKAANDKGKDGVAELIKLFKGEFGGLAFTTQDQVHNIRISHLLFNKTHTTANLRQDNSIDDLTTIISKLTLCESDVSMKDGNNFNLVPIAGDGNCFYSAVADQLKTLDIKIKNNQPNHQELRKITIDYIKKNTHQELGVDLVERLQASNSELRGDLPSNIRTIDEYVEHHCKEGVWADSRMVAALAQAFGITLRVYPENGIPTTYNAPQDEDSTVKKILNLQYTSNHYNSLIEANMGSKKQDELKSYVLQIDDYYDKLKEWGRDELTRWSRENKGKLCRNFSESPESANAICKAIAVMNRANELATGGQRFRDTQKVAVLIFMQTNTRGHISQINTGEGKTTIVSIVEALKVMQGYKGHVITSNNVLAADGVKDKHLFYDLLNISAADNNPDEKYTAGPRACYRQDIVYGSMTSFQFDWLRDSFEQLQTFGEMKDFNNVWVMLDEIDSLLIDQGSNIAKLSGPFPGMESLRYIYINIWVALAKTEEQVTQGILEKLKSKAKELSEDASSSEAEKQMKYEEYEDSLRETFLDEIKTQIKHQKSDLINKRILARHLHQYAEVSVERWIEHAFTAKYQYHENVEYKISKDKDGENVITPIDNQNTGVSMKNTILSNGLHQFLQIKHNLCLTYESLTSCYVSNLDYIKKYGNKLSGVTGTLGSKPERNLLGSVFNLEFSVIPPFKPKQFIRFPGKVSADGTFANDVAVAALGELTRTQIEYDEEAQPIELHKPRAVLIVCASISDVEIIDKEIDREAKAAGLTVQIRKYRDESDAHITESSLDAYDIVIATNLAGRGTDFKTSARLEANGGLHVIEAFLPCNKRVEDQGLGRTGRQGNKGSGQIFTKISELEALGIAVEDNIEFDEIIERRDELETIRLNDIADNKITELEFKGQLFNKFSSQYGALKKKHKVGTDVIRWIYVLRDLKEKWAFWLEQQAYTAESIKKLIAKQQSLFTKKEDQCSKAVEKEYNRFLDEAKPIFNGIISYNPFYSICLAERYLENSSVKADREKAKAELEHALEISKSSDLLYSAYIKLFEVAIENGGQVLKRYLKAVSRIVFFPLESICGDFLVDYKKHALENLRKAESALGVEYEYLDELMNGKKSKNNDNEPEESAIASIIFSPAEEPHNNPKAEDVESNPNLFVKHLQARLICLGAYKGNIDSLIKQMNGENELEKPEDSIGPKDGIIIDAKVPRYLSKLDSKNDLKKHITDRSVSELEYVGLSSVYQLRKIHDVHEEVIAGAQIQIGAAFALLASAAAFPVLLPVNGPLASAMISEAITDIITALIQQGQTAFNKKDYIKGKVISYGITILTMGISAIMSSTKILQKATNACRSLASKLRSVKGPFAGVCQFLANKLDKLAKYLEFMIEKIEFARKTAAEQAKHLANLKDVKKIQQFQQLQKTLKFSDAVLSHGQQISQIVTQAAIGAVKGVIISVAIERIVIAGLNNLMTGLQPIIKKKVHDAVKSKIEHNKGTFYYLSESEINQAVKELFETSLLEDIQDVGKEIALGILRHSSNWKMQLATLAFESILAVVDISAYTDKICDKFDKELRKRISDDSKNHNHNADVIAGFVSRISEQISGILYGKIVAITGKVVTTLPKALYRGYKKRQDQKADDKAIAEMEQKLNQIDTADSAAKTANTKCVHDAVSESLGLDSKQLADATNLGASEDGASIEDTKRLFKQNGIEVTTCNATDAQSQFAEQNSDRGVVCLSDDHGNGHALPVTMEGNSLLVTEGGKKIPLEQYKQERGYTNAELVIPKGVNSTTLENFQHQCNLNRIVKATHPIDYVGRDGDKKFGRVQFIYDSNKPEEIGTFTGHPRSVLRMVEGGRITDGAQPAHTIECHVGKVEGKSSFKNKKDLDDKYFEARQLIKKNPEKVTIISKDMPKNKGVCMGVREEIVVRVDKFEGYNNKQLCDFKYMKIIRDRPNGRTYFLPQTIYPCDRNGERVG